MYVANLFNSRGYFQRTSGWMQMPSTSSGGRAFAVVLQRAGQVLFHLDQCKQLHAHALAQFCSHLQREPYLPASLHAWSPVVSGLIVELSGALAALRVMQNDSWGLISAVSGARDTPASIRDAHATLVRRYGHGNKRPRWLETIDQETKSRVVNYWEMSGVHLANYRDVDQHLDVLARGAIFFPELEGPARLSIQLPDNPEAKSRTRFTYARGTDALDTAMVGFDGLHALLESLARDHGAMPQPVQQAFEFNPPIEHHQGTSALTAIALDDVDGRGGTVFGQNEALQVTMRRVELWM